jgi:hypothetical protein
LWVTVSENVAFTQYFSCTDSSIHFLLGNDAPAPEGATIHSIAPPPLVQIDNDKIGFTLDVAMRLDQEQSSDVVPQGVIISMVEYAPGELADFA